MAVNVEVDLAEAVRVLLLDDDMPTHWPDCHCSFCTKRRRVVELLGVEPGAGTPFPISERLRLLSEATLHLLSDHSCDHLAVHAGDRAVLDPGREALAALLRAVEAMIGGRWAVARYDRPSGSIVEVLSPWGWHNEVSALLADRRAHPNGVAPGLLTMVTCKECGASPTGCEVCNAEGVPVPEGTCGATVGSGDRVVACTKEPHGPEEGHQAGVVKWNYDARVAGRSAEE